MPIGRSRCKLLDMGDKAKGKKNGLPYMREPIFDYLNSKFLIQNYFTSAPLAL